MDTQGDSGRLGLSNAEYPVLGRLIGIQGRLARPYWGFMGGWAAFCGALASDQLRWDGEILLTLALVLILVDLAWGSLWDLATGMDWFRLLREGWPLPERTRVPGLPYTQPDSPGGRLSLRLDGLVGWWRQIFWPNAGPVLLGLVASVALIVILSFLLPDRLRLLNAALVALIGLGVIQRKRGKDPLAGQALVQVGVSWLAGHLIFGEMERASLALALVFSVASWGALRTAKGRRGGLWLLNGGLMVGVALAVGWKQPLASGAMGLLFFGAVALQLSLWPGDDVARVNLRDRTGPWLMSMMLVAALAMP